MIIQGLKEQKQAAIEHNTKILQKHAILPWKLGVNSTNKQRKWNDEFVKKSISLKLINRVALIRCRGAEKNRKINKRGAFIWHLRVRKCYNTLIAEEYFKVSPDLLFSKNPFDEKIFLSPVPLPLGQMGRVTRWSPIPASLRWTINI